MKTAILSELEQTPEEYIPELLKLIRVFRQIQPNSKNAWNSALDQILEEIEDAEDVADAEVSLQEFGFITLADVKKELKIS
jgi:tRNA uridine 5-carbamoylmethylation protein Kti12